MRLKLREPGEHLETFPDQVAVEYHCDKRPLPFFQVEESELLPQRVKAGRDFNHRLVYVLCPAHPTEVVAGRLRTSILHRGSPVYSESIDHELKPGRWTLDAFVSLPEHAEPGIYALRAEFRSATGDFEVQGTFAVEQP